MEYFCKNSEDSDEVPHNAAYHKCLNCCLNKIDLQRKKNNNFANTAEYRSNTVIMTTKPSNVAIE